MRITLLLVAAEKGECQCHATSIFYTYQISNTDVRNKSLKYNIILKNTKNIILRNTKNIILKNTEIRLPYF
jgi:hypothetical protein